MVRYFSRLTPSKAGWESKLYFASLATCPTLISSGAGERAITWGHRANSAAFKASITVSSVWWLVTISLV
jgi:hypothetical protein